MIYRLIFTQRELQIEPWVVSRRRWNWLFLAWKFRGGLDSGEINLGHWKWANLCRMHFCLLSFMASVSSHGSERSCTSACAFVDTHRSTLNTTAFTLTVDWINMQYWFKEQLRAAFFGLFSCTRACFCKTRAASPLEKVGWPLCPSKSFGIHPQAWPWQLFVFPLRREWKRNGGMVRGRAGGVWLMSEEVIDIGEDRRRMGVRLGRKLGRRGGGLFLFLP